MLPKFAAISAFVVAVLAIIGSYSQIFAFRMGQQNQFWHWPHRNTNISGIRYNNRWHPAPNRSDYNDFRGGGIGAGK